MNTTFGKGLGGRGRGMREGGRNEMCMIEDICNQSRVDREFQRVYT